MKECWVLLSTVMGLLRCEIRIGIQLGALQMLANAQGFATFINDTVYEDFENAWNAVEAYLPSEWGALADLKFTADNAIIF